MQSFNVIDEVSFFLIFKSYLSFLPEICITFNRGFVNFMPQNEIESFVIGICNQYPILKNDCLGLTRDYFDKMFNYIKHHLDTNVCFTFEICQRQPTLDIEVLQQ